MAKAFSKVATASVFALCGSTLAAIPAAAQDQPSRDEDFSLVITAERRTVDLQSSAISATVLNAQDLEDKSVVGLASLQYAAPGIMIADYGSANTFNIRGIGQARVDADMPSGVVIYRDGVPTLTGYFQNAPYYDMAGIEVLRGPQGTFVGKSASAGAVFIRSRDPELDAFGGSWMMGTGNFSLLEAQGVVNIPLSETFAARIAIHREWRDSLFDSIRTNPPPGGVTNASGPYQGDDTRNLASMRVGLLWQPNEAFRALFKVDLDDLDFGSHITSGLDPLTAELEDIWNPIVNGPHIYVDRGARSSLNLSYEFDNGVSLSSLTGFSTVNTTANWDVNGSDPRTSMLLSHGNFTNWSQEFNLVSPEDQRLRWVTGVFWQNYENQYNGFDENGFGFAVDNETRIDFGTPWLKDEISYAVFGQLAFDLTDALELQLGARWSHFEFDQFTNWAIDFGTIGVRNTTGVGLEGTLTFFENGGLGHWESFEEQSTDWKINLNYQVSDDQFLYALVSRGHTPGSVNLSDPDLFSPTRTPEHGSYREMSVINYEAGWKGAFLDRQIRTQLSAYYQIFKDYQADFALAPGPGVPADLTTFQFQNAETDSIIYGVEFGAQAELGAWSFDVGFAYSKSELGSFGAVSNPFALFYGGGATIELDGARTPFAPEITANAGVSYTFNLGGGEGEGWTMTPRVDVAYRDDAYAQLFQNPATLLEGQTLLNAQVRFENGPWWVNVWGTNLTDEEYAGAKQNVGAAGPTTTRPFNQITGFVYAAPPRLFGVRVGRSF